MDVERSGGSSGFARVGALLGWVGCGVCLLYAAFALASALEAVLAWRGVVELDRERAAPLLFVVHALTGAVALAAGALQLRSTTAAGGGATSFHRRLGWAYAVCAPATAVAGFLVTLDYEVGAGAVLAFGMQSTLWGGTTLLGVAAARRGARASHRAWMIRSYALALFFVTFSLVHPAVVALEWSRAATFGLAVPLSTALNVLGGELWLRARRGSTAVAASPSR